MELSRLTRAEKAELISLLEHKVERRDTRGYAALFPDTGPLRRELYPKHLDFFRAGRDFRERCMMAANRVGKTIAAGYETVLHLTGDYPAWWEGRRFSERVDWWVAGKNFETTRDIVQRKLCGPIAFVDGQKTVRGSGLIPKDRIGRITWKGGVQDLIDTVEVKHNTGDWSTLGFKSYEQGRGGFEGTERSGCWLDEEPPADIYGECLMRTATTGGIIMLTFTPLEGATDVVLSFMPSGMLNEQIEALKSEGLY